MPRFSESLKIVQYSIINTLWEFSSRLNRWIDTGRLSTIMHTLTVAEFIEVWIKITCIIGKDTDRTDRIYSIIIFIWMKKKT